MKTLSLCALNVCGKVCHLLCNGESLKCHKHFLVLSQSLCIEYVNNQLQVSISIYFYGGRQERPKPRLVLLLSPGKKVLIEKKYNYPGGSVQTNVWGGNWIPPDLSNQFSRFFLKILVDNIFLYVFTSKPKPSFLSLVANSPNLDNTSREKW